MLDSTPYLFLLKKILSALILPPSSLVLLGFIGLWLAKNILKPVKPSPR